LLFIRHYDGMPQPFPSNPDVEKERRSLLSLGNLRRIASLKRAMERAHATARQPVSREMPVSPEMPGREMTHDIEPRH
jgi:hypothetical protein